MQTFLRLIPVFLFWLLSISAQAQKLEFPLPHDPPPRLYDTAPRYPGGPEAFNRFIRKEMKYPEPEKSREIQGQVYLKFQVNEDGKIENARVVNGVPGGPNLASEALRLLEIMPAWLPATLNGRPVRAEHYISLNFKL
jgi:TonB family protein